MKVHGDYGAAGYAYLEALFPPEVTQALNQFWRDLFDEKLPVAFRQNALFTRPAMELHGSHSTAITSFLWGLTPLISELTGRELLPTYAFLRLYQKGAKLRVHSDRSACEHSLSLTLGYSEDETWAFHIERDDAAADRKLAEDFGDRSYSIIAMRPGDAVLYKGLSQRHGRLDPNPNKWSAHLFLHWVDRAGPYRKHAFERRPDAA